MTEQPQTQQSAPPTVRGALSASAVTIFGPLLGLLAPSAFFARDEQVGPLLYKATMPIRVLVYPVSFLLLPFAAVLLTLLAWLLVVLFAPLIWWRAHTIKAANKS